MHTVRRFAVPVAAALALATAGCSAAAAGAGPESPAAASTDGGAGLFDPSVVHDVSVAFDSEDYEAMVDAYATTGEKEWIAADVTIDGVTYRDAGIRLKGNSSLAGVRGHGPGQATSADEPERLPWLVRLDEFVEGRDHGGVVEFVIRSNVTETSLNEAVALDLLEAAGLASQDAAYARFTVNGGEEALRLLVEHPDDVWMAERLSPGGALYKAESTGDYSYRGDDPDAYDEVFDQEAGKQNADLTPLIEFLEFVNGSDDATFAAELAERLDVGAFAVYLAAQDLIDNFDDIDGPGNNSYLYSDPETGVFTVVPWDHNLAFGVAPAGGGGAPGAGAGPVVPGGADRPQPGGRPAGGGVLPGAPGGGLPGGPGIGSNVLSERFLDVPELAALVQQAREDLTASLFESGLAAGVLDRWTAVLESQAADLVGEATVEEEASVIAAHWES
jgi:spore coat protein CotH